MDICIKETKEEDLCDGKSVRLSLTMAASPAPAKNCFYKNLLPKVSPSRRCENLNMVYESFSAEGRTFRVIFGFDCTSRTEDTDYLVEIQKAIAILEQVLPPVAGDKSISCFTFGDALSLDHGVTCLFTDDRSFTGYKEAFEGYEVADCKSYPAEKRSFGPIIGKATHIASGAPSQPHVLIIFARGPVRSNYDDLQKPSVQEEDTLLAIAQARKYGLSIIIVGVGENSGEVMRGLEDKSSNFWSHKLKYVQYVDFRKLMATVPEQRKEIEFGLAATEKLRSNQHSNRNNKVKENVTTKYAGFVG